MLESILVGLIVVAAGAYAVSAVVPATTRRRWARRGAVAAGGPDAGGLRGQAARLLLGLANASAGGCGDCPVQKLTPAERARRRSGRPE